MKDDFDFLPVRSLLGEIFLTSPTRQDLQVGLFRNEVCHNYGENNISHKPIRSIPLYTSSSYPTSLRVLIDAEVETLYHRSCSNWQTKDATVTRAFDISSTESIDLTRDNSLASVIRINNQITILTTTKDNELVRRDFELGAGVTY